MLGDEEKGAVAAVLEGTTLTHGPLVKRFEADFAAFTGAPHAVAVSSATAGLHLVYFHLGIGPGDEVIVPAQTHVATAHAVEYVGAKPVFVDAERETGSIDIDAVEAAISPRTKVLSIVHYLGMPVDMHRLMAIAERHGLFVVEDCALAIGACLDGTHAGLLGDIGAYSFYPVKHITTAEGGMVITKHRELAEAISVKRAFGIDRNIVAERPIPGTYDVQSLGFNYRLNELGAALGIEQVKRIPAFLEARRANYEALQAELEAILEVETLASSHDGFVSSHYCHLAILLPGLAAKRYEIMASMRAAGVGTSIYYPRPVPLMTYYREKYGYRDGEFPGASRISDNGIALPVGPHLTPDDMRYVADALRNAIGEVR
jgi:perosamine synthetase